MTLYVRPEGVEVGGFLMAPDMAAQDITYLLTTMAINPATNTPVTVRHDGAKRRL